MILLLLCKKKAPNFFLIAFILSSISNIYSQNTWELLNPKPTYNTGKEIHFTSGTTGYIINDYELLETTNSGISWQKKQNIPSGNDLKFNQNVGYIVGNNGYVLKSVDSGSTWSQLTTGFNSNFNTVNIINENDIIISSSNSIIKSSDGGNTWTSKNIPNSTVNKTFFVTPLIGHAACNSGKMLKTIDGGANWYVTQSSNLTPSDLFTVYFINQNIGFYTKQHGDMYKTIDGGETWNKITPISDAIYAFFFLNENVGYAAGDSGVIFKTVNGGNTWTWISPQTGRYDNYDINGLHFINNVGYATGARGRIIKTTDGGNTWTQNSPTYNDVKKIHFFESGIGYAQVGNDYFKTLNNGANWSLVGTANHYSYCSGSYFVNENIGYSIGDGTSISGDVFKTINGGVTWNKLGIEVDEGLSSVFFINENIGFISGGYNQQKTLKTIDGGATWQQVINQEFGQIQFLTDQIGYANRIGYSGGRIYKTIDGGNTWNINFDINETITSFSFTDENNGYFVGNSGLMYKTKNGGVTWEKLTAPYLYFTNVKFYSPNVGYITSDYGEMYKTINGGKSWQKLTTMQINSIAIVNKDIYVAGANGKILKSDISFNPVSILANPVLKPSNKGATLTGNVASNAGLIQNIRFKYGTNYTFDNVVNTTPNEAAFNSSLDVSTTLQNLIPSTTYYYKIIGTYNNIDYSSEILNFTTLPNFELTMNYIYTYTSNTAEVSGYIKSNENNISDIEFQYSTKADFSNFDSLSNSALILGNTAQNITGKLSNLIPKTKYYVRIKAVQNGIVIFSSVESFTTKSEYSISLYNPSINGNNANLSALIYANSNDISNIVFEYGSKKYENSLTTNPNTIVYGSSGNVTSTIQNLDPNKVYFYRLKALNGNTIIYSNENVFNTSGEIILTSGTTKINNTSTTLVGLINSYGKYITDIQFEYGITENYGSTINSNVNYIYNYGTNNITATIDNLLPNQIYYYRIKAKYNDTFIYSDKFEFNSGFLNTLDFINDSKIYLYPNPTQNEVTISLLNEFENVNRIILLDVSGKIIYSKDNPNIKNNFKINLSNKSRGVYFVKIFLDNNKTITKKLMLN